MQKLTLTADQEHDLARMISEPTKALLLGHEPGFGKTVLAAEFIVRQWFQHGLIVGPKALYQQWADTLYAQSDGAISLRKMDSTKPGEQAILDYQNGVPSIYFIGVQLLTSRDHILYTLTDSEGNVLVDQKGKERRKRQRLGIWAGGPGMDVVDGKPKRVTRPLIRPDFILYDESHMASNRYSNAADTLSGMDAEWKICMSGTFYADKFDNAYTPTFWLWGDRTGDVEAFNPSFTKWKMRWCATKSVYVPGGRAVTQVTGEKNPGEFVKRLPCYIRREALTAPPAPKDVKVQISAEQRRVYDELETQMLAWLGDHPLSVDFPITLQAYLRMVALADPSIDDEGKIHFESTAASSKADTAIKALNTVWKGENVFHLTSSKRYANYLVERLRSAGFVAEVYSGDTKPAERERIKREFSEGKIQNLVGVIAATGTGLNGLQMSCTKILEHNTQVGQPSMMAQAVRRIWRQGNTRLDAFEHVRLVSDRTIEQGQYSNLDLQMAAQKMSLKGAA